MYACTEYCIPFIVRLAGGHLNPKYRKLGSALKHIYTTVGRSSDAQFSFITFLIGIILLVTCQVPRYSHYAPQDTGYTAVPAPGCCVLDSNELISLQRRTVA